MSRRVKINLILLAGIVLPPLSYLFMSFDLGMSIAVLQLLLCYNLRGRFSWLVRLLPLIAVAPFHLLGLYWIVTASGAGGIPGILLLAFTTLPTLGLVLGWAAWAVLRGRGIL